MSLRSLVSACVFFGAIAACAAPRGATRSAKNVASTAPTPTTPTEPVGDPALAKSWKDAEVVARLAKDCRWTPPALTQMEHSEVKNALSCVLEEEQSCVPDVCFDEDQRDCKPTCVKECAGCSDACATNCESCKGKCRGDACRNACATRCGACHDACVRAEDRCRTGTCSARRDACEKRIVDEWRHSSCTAACKRVMPCATACWKKETGGNECLDACIAKRMTGCPAYFFPYCIHGVKPELKGAGSPRRLLVVWGLHVRRERPPLSGKERSEGRVQQQRLPLRA